MWRFTRPEVEEAGGSLLETAIMVPVLLVLILFGINFGYYFLVATNLATSSRNSVLYSAQGYSSPAQGELADAASVAAAAKADLSGLAASGTDVTVQVCSMSVGLSGNKTQCNGTTYTPDTDPEAPVVFLQRVDVTYTVKPPVPLNFMNYQLVPSLQFHRQAEMRAIN